MAISDKLTYLNETKNLLKTQINYGLPTEQQITSSTTFREYVSSIFEAFLEALRNPDTLFTNLPKKSGTGSNITLNDTANAPMRIMLNATELTQAGTPTPSSPQDIHTISGSNKVVVNGKNLFNKDSITNNYYYDASGNYVAVNETYLSDYINVNANESYTLQTALSSTTKRVNYFDSNKNWLSQVNTGNANLTFTTPNNTKYIRVSFNQAVNKDNIQIELGTTATTYEPYTSQEADIDLGELEYCKIGNYEDKFIRTSGKNLFDGNYLNAVIGGNSGNQFFLNDDTRTAIIKVEPNTQYTITKYTNTGIGTRLTIGGDATYKTPSNSTFLDYIYTNNTTFTTYTLTTRATDNYLYIYVTNDATSIPYLMVNEGITALDYEPYGSNEWYIKKYPKKKVFDGTENWTTRTGGTSYAYALADVFDANAKSGLSNYWKVLAGAASNSQANECIATASTNASLNIFTNNSNLNTLENFKSWLSTHNLIVYYPLATPTYTPITGTLAEQLENVYKNMLSQAGVTNISQINNDLAFVLDVQAIEGI